MLVYGAMKLQNLLTGWLAANGSAVKAFGNGLFIALAILLVSTYATKILISIMLRMVRGKKTKSNGSIGAVIVSSLVIAISVLIVGAAKMFFNFMKSTYNEIGDGLKEYGWKPVWSNLVAALIIVAII